MKWKERILKWIWPTMTCVLCGEACDKLYPGLCGSCLEKIVKNREKEVFCSRCGVFYPNTFRECPHCFLKERIYRKNGIFSALPYDDLTRVPVMKLKYNNRRDLVETMTRLFFRFSEIEGDFDVVTAVPLHKNRLRQRGYNQSELFARAIAEKMELPYEELLCRTVDTPSQTKQSSAGRRHNLIGAFSALPEAEISGRRILLIDDVVTTGATVGECISVLRKAGADFVAVGTLCAFRSRQGQ